MEQVRPTSDRRWRRPLSVLAVAVATVLPTACGGGSTGGGASSAPASSAPAASTPGQVEGGRSLPSGEFVGRFTRVDPATAHGTFVVRCPAATAGATYTVNLKGGTFEQETKPSDPAAGHAEELTLAQWARVATRSEWNVSTRTPAGPVMVRAISLPSDHTVC